MGRLVEQMIEVGQDAVDELSTTQVACIQVLREESEQVACLLNRLVPITGGRGCQQVFEVRLSRSQRFLVSLDLGSEPSKVGCLLGRHAAMSIEIGRFIGHNSFLHIRCQGIRG